MKNIVISNPLKLEKIKKEFKKGGAEKIHILSDFERTLTYAFIGGKKVPSLISVLRSGNDYLGKEYAEKAQQLFEKYHPFEVNPKIPIKEKKKAMKEWWEKHFKLLIRMGLSKRHLKMVVDSGKVKLRKGAKEFFKLLKKNKIPLVVMSASGLGNEAISMFFKKEKVFSPNIFIISNEFLWDKNGKVIGIKKPIVHSLNKDETVIRSFPSIFKRVRERKNVLLLGDNLEDVRMIKGFDYNFLIKIGFLNENVKENLRYYKKTYDCLILNDFSFSFVNSLLKEILARKK